MYTSLEKNVVAKYNLFYALYCWFLQFQVKKERHIKITSFISEEVTISSSLPSALITIKIFTPKGEYNNVNIV